MMRSRSASNASSQSLMSSSPSPMSLSLTSVNGDNGPLNPCAATTRLFLYAQASSILCLQHDSLSLERRFERHVEDVAIVAVESVGEEFSARVVSVDRAKQAIVWEANSGDEVARYSGYEDIRVAAWMKNGNLAFGDAMGNVILFDPSRSESISARTIFDPLTSIAPSADCKSFALGYNNGSILVAALTPSFTILHTLTTTSLSPSPVVSLGWHASSSRQKSDMLATQTRDGDLRVWSVPKSLQSDDTARVVRILKRPESNRRGNNWLGWSRNGRIVHFSDGTSTIWDVRTKKVSWEEVPTLDNLTGIAVYGGKGVLFTTGKDHTVQQFSLYPPTLVANVHQPPTVPPPSPPVSIEEKREEEEPRYDDKLHSMPEEDELIATMSPLGRIAHELEQLEKMELPDAGLGISNVPGQRAASVSSRSSGGSVESTGSRHRHNISTSSKGSDQSEVSPASTASAGRKGSIGAQSQASPRRQHPLRQEIHPSPEQEHAAKVMSPVAEVSDLFSHLQSRMAHVTYESPRIGSPQSNLSEDDHRREMLYCIFGWRGDIEGLINDELDSANARSLNAVVLRMWLGDLDQNSLAVLLGADFNVSGDWLFLALSAMGGQKSWNHVVRAFVMHLLQKGDLHVAVLCLLALGDKNDAVEVYVSHKRYMEAVLLTSLLWKKDWKRLSQLIRKWGEHASANYEGGLAARCFACAGTEPPTERPMERPAPPTRQHSRSHSRSRSENESINSFVRGLSISAPSNPRTTLRMTPKNSPLKLITAFPPAPPDPIQRSATTSPTTIGGVNRFFSGGGPRSATATPIAMSALTPVDPFWQHDSFPSSARTITPGGAKLAPVTESSPAEQTPTIERLQPPVPEEKDLQISSPVEARNSSGFSESRPPVTLGEHNSRNNSPAPPVSRRASPPVENKVPTPPPGGPPTDPLPAPPVGVFHSQHGRKASSARKPAGLQIQWPPIDSILNKGESKHKRKGSKTTPPPPVPLTRPTGPAPRPGGKPSNELDSFMDLIEKGQKRLDSQRATPKGTPNLRGVSPDRRRPSQASDISEPEIEPRGRQEARPRVPGTLMRSPSSPLPMSPQARLYREEVEEADIHEEPEPLSARYYGDEPVRGRSESRNAKGSTTRSPSSPLPFAPQAAMYRADEDDDVHDDEFDDERYYTSSRVGPQGRGRSRSKTVGASAMRSPSSPLPMSPQAKLYQEMSLEVDRQDEIEEERERSRYRARRPTRTDSRTRGPQSLSRSRPSFRRSRSEHTLRQWSHQLERDAEIGRASPVPTLARNASIRGLPSNPKVWRAELQAASRSNSPAPSQLRGRSPGISPSPGPPQRSMTPGQAMSPASRTMSPASRTMSPASRALSPVGRTMSPLRAFSPPENFRPTTGRKQSIDSAISQPRSANFYYSPTPAEYESIPTTPEVPLVPGVPPLPALSRMDSHKRNNSEPPTPPVLEPLYRKLGPQIPPDSPPPLPSDLPVHPALQMHLEPSQPGHSKTLRRIKRSNELSPIDRETGFRDQEESILVGLEAKDVNVPVWEEPPMIQQLSQMRAHTTSPGHSLRMAPAPPPMSYQEAIGSMNRI